MKQRGWTAYHLSQEAEIPQSTISNLFNRPYEPTISTLEVLCKGFGITLSEFFSEDGRSTALTKEQREMLDQWGKLSEKQREGLLSFLKTL